MYLIRSEILCDILLSLCFLLTGGSRGWLSPPCFFLFKSAAPRVQGVGEWVGVRSVVGGGGVFAHVPLLSYIHTVHTLTHTSLPPPLYFVDSPES